MNVEKKLITPSIAKQLLESNNKNRNVRKQVVDKYAKEMQSGAWKQDTFELIKISSSNIILDGQHRLLAVVKSNTPVYFHIASGLNDDIFDVLDTGANRSASDVFRINGIKYSTQTPSIIILYERLKKLRKTGGLFNRNEAISNAQALSLYNEKPTYWDNVSLITHDLYIKFAKILTPQLIGGLYAYFNDLSVDGSIDFMEQLCTGFEITNKSIWHLRNKLIEDKTSVKKMPTTLKLAIIIKTWNFYRNNKEAKLIKFAIQNESMPVAI